MTPSGTVFWELSDDCDGKVGKVTFEWYKDGEDGEIVVQEEVIAPTNTWYQLPVSELEDGAKYILSVSSYNASILFQEFMSHRKLSLHKLLRRSL